jgi:hypothetical protein
MSVLLAVPVFRVSCKPAQASRGKGNLPLSRDRSRSGVECDRGNDSLGGHAAV